MRTECPKCGSNNLNAAGTCRPCHAAYMRGYMNDPARRAKKQEADRAYRTANREAIESRRAEKVKARNADPEIKKRKKAWYEANKAKIATAAKERYARLKGTPEFKAKRAEYEAKRRAESPTLRIHQRMSAHVRSCLKGNKAGRSWEKLVGYTLADLVTRLRLTVPEGWTWQDFLEARLEIDHVVPVSAFRFETAEDPEFLRCWALDNLQLLPEAENNEKRATVPEWFKPA